MKLKIEGVPPWQQRTALLLGKDKLEKLRDSHVLIIGLGGVGAYAAELICRAGVGKITIADGDVTEVSNRNRQLPALVSTEGKSKAEIVAARLRDINPEVEIIPLHKFIRDESADLLLEQNFDYVVDAIDSLSPKVNLIVKCLERKIPLISSMGSGGKTDPAQVKVVDISKTFNCSLAKAVRKLLHRRGIRKGFKTVFSPQDIPETAVFAYEDTNTGMCRSMVGTISYMPAIFGCYCASVVIRELMEKPATEK